MDNIVIIILNYNSVSETRELINHIRSIKLNLRIVVVDNFYSHKEVANVRALKTEFSRIDIVLCLDNGGYAAGNNSGIHYAIKNYNPEMVLICNPDIIFSKEALLDLYENFKNDKYAGVAGLEMRDMHGKILTSAWKLPNFFDELFLSLIFIYRLFGNRCEYKRLNKGIHKVEVVQGAMFMAKTKILEQVRFLDERTFLYGEERILGAKFKKNGYYALYINSSSFIHKVSYSINKSYNLVKKYKELVKSKKIYFKYYKSYSSYVAYRTIAFLGTIEKYIITSFKND